MVICYSNDIIEYDRRTLEPSNAALYIKLDINSIEKQTFKLRPQTQTDLPLMAFSDDAIRTVLPLLIDLGTIVPIRLVQIRQCVFVLYIVYVYLYVKLCMYFVFEKERIEPLFHCSFQLYSSCIQVDLRCIQVIFVRSVK